MRPIINKNNNYNEVKAKLTQAELDRDHYISLAEAREFSLDTILKPSHDILSVRGVLLTMIAEVTLYATKNGKTDKYQKSMDRLMFIDEFLNTCNSVNDHNYQLRMMLKRSIIQRDNLENANNKLKQELEAIKKAFNEE